LISLEEGARKVVEVCARVRPHERVLVLTDSERPPEVARALLGAIAAVGAEGDLAEMPSGGPAGGEPPDEVLPAIARADVVLTPTTRVMYHSKAAHGVAARGGRVLSLTMCGRTTLTEGAIEADFEGLEQLCLGLCAKLDAAREIRITSPAGTEITASLHSRNATGNTAILRGPGVQGCPTVEAFIAPVEDSANGTLVIDGSTSFGLVDQPIVIRIADGAAISIEGGTAAAKVLREVEDSATSESRTLAEIAIGLNPAARVIGNLIEDEGAYGTGHFALGRNVSFGGQSSAPIHIDMVYFKPSVWLDGARILADGVLVD
jgi:leucyl aminopeptidase (aminopeptidase T)